MYRVGSFLFIFALAVSCWAAATLHQPGRLKCRFQSQDGAGFGRGGRLGLEVPWRFLASEP